MEYPLKKAIERKSGKPVRKRSIFLVMTTVLLVLPALGMIPNSTAQTLPAGIVHDIPIAIINSQPIATPSPFQQMVTVDSALYSSYEASNLQNIEFFYPNGTIIPSWLESGASNSSNVTIYWLKISSGIPANSTITVYMGFASPATNLFNTQTTGEAPELSLIYGQYDDGGQVFTSYQGFVNDANSLPAGWYGSGFGGDCSYINAGIVNGYHVVGVNGCGTVYAGSSIPVNSNLAVDVQTYGLQAVGTDWQSPFVNSASPTSFSPQGDALTWFDDNARCNASNSSATLALSSGPGGSQLGSGVQIFPVTVLTITNSQVLSNYTAIVSGEAGILAFSGYLALATHTSTACGSAIWGYWVRTRALPPNGVMPSINGVITDNFREDNSLYMTLWTTGTSPLGKLACADTTYGCYSFPSPELSFSSSGMEMTGANGSYTFTGIQTIDSFLLPIELKTEVRMDQSHGGTFELFLVNSEASNGIEVFGNGEVEAALYGISTAVLGLSGRTSLYHTAQVGTPYIIDLSLNSSGYASVDLENSTNIIGTQTNIFVGNNGPFFVVLCQSEGWPPVVGVNQATWAYLNVNGQLASSTSSPAFSTTTTPTTSVSSVFTSSIVITTSSSSPNLALGLGSIFESWSTSLPLLLVSVAVVAVILSGSVIILRKLSR